MIDGDTAYTIFFGLLAIVMYQLHKEATEEWEKPPYSPFFGLVQFGTAVLTILSSLGFLVGIIIKLFYYFTGN